MGTSKERKRVTLWIGKTGDGAVRAEAERRGVSASDLYREVFRLGWETYQEIRKGTK